MKITRRSILKAMGLGLLLRSKDTKARAFIKKQTCGGYTELQTLKYLETHSGTFGLVEIVWVPKEAGAKIGPGTDDPFPCGTWITPTCSPEGDFNGFCWLKEK